MFEWAQASSLRRNGERLWRWWSSFFFKGLFQTKTPLRNSVIAVAREMRRMLRVGGQWVLTIAYSPGHSDQNGDKGPAWPPSPVPSSLHRWSSFGFLLRTHKLLPSNFRILDIYIYLICWLLGKQKQTSFVFDSEGGIIHLVKHHTLETCKEGLDNCLESTGPFWRAKLSSKHFIWPGLQTVAKCFLQFLSGPWDKSSIPVVSIVCLGCLRQENLQACWMTQP